MSWCSENNNNINKTIDYLNDPRFSERQALASSADPDQTAVKGIV